MGVFAGTDGLRLAPGERWHVAATLPRKEAFALEHLANQGFHPFFPRQKVTKRHAGRFRTELVPVFPGYIFIAFDVATMPWRAINGTRGIRRLITENERPLPVRAGVVETLLRSVDDRWILGGGDDLAPGRTVRVLTGPFAAQLARVHDLDAAGRVRLLLDLMGQSVRVTIPRAEVMSV